MGLIFSIASQKGGVGKTTTTVQLGIALAERQKKTLLIDADPQGGLMSVFHQMTANGFASESNNPGLYDVFCGKADLTDIKRPTPWVNLHYIQPGINGNSGPLQAFEDAHQAVGLLREALQQSIGQFDVILIDCPPGMGVVVTSALNASDYVIIPVQSEPLGLRTFPVFIQYLIGLKNSWPASFELSGILMTMGDEDEVTSRTVMSQIRNFFDPDSVYRTVIPRDPSLNEMFIDPLRVSEFYRDLETRSAGIRAYKELAAYLIRQYSI